MAEGAKGKERLPSEEGKQIHMGHRRRMRQIALTEGLDGFTDVQIVEMFLFSVFPNGDTNPLAHRLLERFGSIRGILEARQEDLLTVKGIGESAANFIRFTQLFAGYYLRSSSFSDPVKKRFRTTESIRGYFEGAFLGVTGEQIRAMAVTEDLYLVKEEMILAGTFGKVELSARKLADFALRNGCDRLILAHNHPRGFAVPSNVDCEVTTKLSRLLFELDILLLDHVIVSAEGSISLRGVRNGRIVWADELERLQKEMRSAGNGVPCPDEEEGPLDTPELDEFMRELSGRIGIIPE